MSLFPRIALVLLAFAPVSLRAHGDLHERIERVSAEIEAAPESAELHWKRATLRLQHGEPELALNDLEKVGELAPGRFPIELPRGEALVRLERWNDARRALDRFLREHPGHGGALRLRAQSFRKIQRADDALRDYHAAIRFTRPADPDLFREATDFLVDQERYGEALQILDEAMAGLGPLPSLINRSIDLEVARGHWDAALARVDRLCEASARPEPWMARRASILAQAGRLDESRQAWNELSRQLSRLPPGQKNSRAMMQLALQSVDALKALPAEPR